MEYRKIIEIEIRDFTREVFEKTWVWLNDPQVKDLTDSPDFDKESSEKWFESLKTRNDYYIKSIWHNNKPLGVLGLKYLNGIDGETFGYLGEKEYWGKAIGIEGLQHLVDYGRSIKLESIYSVIIKKNVVSYKLNRRLGFVREEDKDENNIVMRYYY